MGFRLIGLNEINIRSGGRLYALWKLFGRLVLYRFLWFLINMYGGMQWQLFKYAFIPVLYYFAMDDLLDNVFFEYNRDEGYTRNVFFY